jgi:hypothetical protein
MIAMHGLEKIVRMRRAKGDLGEFSFNRPAKRLLMHYKRRGAPIKYSSPPWTTMRHISHDSTIKFIESEFMEMRKDSG